eukprot:3332329-Rhodomonas_salina.2
MPAPPLLNTTESASGSATVVYPAKETGYEPGAEPHTMLSINGCNAAVYRGNTDAVYGGNADSDGGNAELCGGGAENHGLNAGLHASTYHNAHTVIRVSLCVRVCVLSTAGGVPGGCV